MNVVLVESEFLLKWLKFENLELIAFKENERQRILIAGEEIFSKRDKTEGSSL